MGVTWVLDFPLNEANAALGPQVVKEVEKQLKSVGAEPNGHFKVDSLPYKPSESGISYIYLMHHSDYPQTTFTIGSDQEGKVARGVSGKGFDLILGKLASGLVPDAPGRFDSTGDTFVLGDFVVRVGAVSMAAAFKGVTVEIEYCPLNVVSCSSLMHEFIRAALPSLSPYEQPSYVSRLQQQNELYQPVDTLNQYLDIFVNLRKRSSAIMTQMSTPLQHPHFLPDPSNCNSILS